MLNQMFISQNKKGEGIVPFFRVATNSISVGGNPEGCCVKPHIPVMLKESLSLKIPINKRIRNKMKNRCTHRYS